jgi:hypothetical protein
MSEDEKPLVIEINSGNLAAMLPNPDNTWCQPHVYELDGPPQAYFEIPLDWFANGNAEIEPGASPGAVRLVQRVIYYSFQCVRDSEASCQQVYQDIVGAVHKKLKATNEITYLWWRKRPTYSVEQVKKLLSRSKVPQHKVSLRLGTCPSLPTAFWKQLSDDVRNISSDPVGGQGRFR